MDINKNLLNFESKAPGKIIISGEHAVVYDSKAIACAINLFTTCKIDVQTETGNELIFNLVNLNKKFKFEIADLAYVMEYNKIFENIFTENDLINIEISNFINLIRIEHTDSNVIHFIYLFNLIISFLIFKLRLEINETIEKILKFFKNSQINITIFSDIPHNAGLGSSAAFNVSLTSCLVDLLIEILSLSSLITDNNKNNNLILLSFLGEKFFHSKPSGIDNITLIQKGLVLFHNFSSYCNLESSFFSKIKFYLIDTRVRRDTKTFIKKVNHFRKDFGNIFSNCLKSINIIVEDLNEIISSNGNYKKFAKLIEINQNYLQIIQVSTQEIDSIVSILKHNNIPSKLTGAGGGGFVLAFVRFKDTGKFFEIVDENKFNIIECEMHN